MWDHTYSVVHEDETTEVLASPSFEHHPEEQYGDSATQAEVWAEDLGLDVVEVDSEARTVIVTGPIDFVLARINEED